MKKQKSQKSIDSDSKEFIMAVAHDLSNPLGALREFVRLLLNEHHLGPLNLKQEEVLHITERTCMRMHDLMDDIIDILKLNSNPNNLKRTSIHVKKAAQKAIQFLKTDLSKKNIKARITASQPLPPIQADGTRLTRIFTNIISNSIKFSRPQDTITINIKNEPKRIFCTITDNGLPVTEEQKKQIFNPTQTNGGSRRGGFKMLAAKCVIESHGGRMSIGSKDHHGCQITFWLPKKI